MKEIKIRFVCDAKNNKECTKENCFLSMYNGCKATSDINFSKNINKETYNKLLNLITDNVHPGSAFKVDGHTFIVDSNDKNEPIYLSEEKLYQDNMTVDDINSIKKIVSIIRNITNMEMMDWEIICEALRNHCDTLDEFINHTKFEIEKLNLINQIVDIKIKK